MKLAIFDIDGTLLDNHAIEDACYARALCDQLALPALDTNWAGYRDVTDDGVAREAYERAFGRPLSADGRDATIGRFVALLREAVTANGIVPIDGARDLFDRLRAADWHVALATGAWAQAAMLKLAAAGLRCDGLPIATSEDGPARVDIIAAARRRAEASYQIAAFERIVCVGDGVWDVEAARALGYPFVGLARDDRRSALLDRGATVVLPNFADLEQTLAALETAGRPLERIL